MSDQTRPTPDNSKDSNSDIEAMKESLETELDYMEVVDAIKELYSVDEEVAQEMWRKFLETAKKLAAIRKEGER